MTTKATSLRKTSAYVTRRWGTLPKISLAALERLLAEYRFCLEKGDVQLIENRWYVTHSGLLALAKRKGCAGIHVRAVSRFCEPAASRWAFKATVYRSSRCRGFIGYGEADPSNVSDLVRGAEMRVAETRAVNRALRKAYGIGICSVEEIGPFAGRVERSENVRKLPPQPANGNGQPKLRDQLCLLIRQHRLDAAQVKQYAAEFCSVPDLRQVTREQIQSFITHLAELAKNDREGLLCKLNSLAQKPAGAA